MNLQLEIFVGDRLLYLENQDSLVTLDKLIYVNYRFPRYIDEVVLPAVKTLSDSMERIQDQMPILDQHVNVTGTRVNKCLAALPR